VDSLKAKILEFEAKPADFWNTQTIKNSVTKFSSEAFVEQVKKICG
jgi:hypothetical protein